MNNSVNQVVEFLSKNPLSTEKDILWGCWSFVRNQYQSNKKYAELIRRGLDKGLYKRIEMDVKGNRSKYFYYVDTKQ